MLAQLPIPRKAEFTAGRCAIERHGIASGGCRGAIDPPSGPRVDNSRWARDTRHGRPAIARPDTPQTDCSRQHQRSRAGRCRRPFRACSSPSATTRAATTTGVSKRFDVMFHRSGRLSDRTAQQSSGYELGARRKARRASATCPSSHRMTTAPIAYPTATSTWTITTTKRSRASQRSERMRPPPPSCARPERQTHLRQDSVLIVLIHHVDRRAKQVTATRHRLKPQIGVTDPPAARSRTSALLCRLTRVTLLLRRQRAVAPHAAPISGVEAPRKRARAKPAAGPEAEGRR